MCVLQLNTQRAVPLRPVARSLISAHKNSCCCCAMLGRIRYSFHMFDCLIYVCAGRGLQHRMNRVFKKKRGGGWKGPDITVCCFCLHYFGKTEIVQPEIHWGSLWSTGDYILFFSLSLSRYMCLCVLLRTPVVIASGRPRGKTIWAIVRGGVYMSWYHKYRWLIINMYGWLSTRY